MRKLLTFVSVFLLAVLALVPSVAAAPPTRLTLAATAAGDTFRITATWPAVADGQTPAPSYAVAWRWHKYPVNTAFPTVGPTKTITTTADSISLAMPNYPDSMWVEVRVTATRGGYNATTTTATKFFKKPNPTPPPVPSITLDTAASTG